MRRIDLRELRRSPPHPLSVEQREALRDVLPDDKLTIEPAPGTSDAYILRPGSTIGALDIGDLSVSIQPKLPIGRVLYLASHALGAVDFREERFGFGKRTSLVEALVPMLTAAARRAFARGLLHGYRNQEEALHTVRGRIRVADQIRNRFGMPIPVEVRYDDFTADVLANRLVRAAADRLGKLRIRSPRSRRDLAWVAATLDNVSLVEYPTTAVPEVKFDRLNEHYREVLTLARLILRHTSVETERGRVRANGFLVDMNVVFQDFVTRSLRQALGLSESALRSDRRLPRIDLDEAGTVRLKPDLTWWEGPSRSVCTFVGDAKYKRVGNEHVHNADLYQLLAYTTALDLPGGLLIYAQGEAEDAVHRVRHAGKQLEIATLDLSGDIDELKAEIARLAERVRGLRRTAIALRQAA